MALDLRLYEISLSELVQVKLKIDQKLKEDEFYEND